MTREHVHECARECGRCFVCPVDQCPGEWICPVCLDADREAFFHIMALEAEQQEIAR